MLHTMIGRGNRMGDVYRLELLGRVQITRAGEPVRGFRSRKALALLAYLIRQKQAVARPRLADLFWPDKPEALGRRNLSWVLSRISTRLPECLQADRHSIQYQPNPALWVDVLAFEALVRQNDPAALTEAAALYRGAFMEDLYLEGCPDFETWLVSEQETWRRQVIQVLDRLVAHHGQHRAYGQAQQFASRLLALEPWREETHRHLMRLLALSGQRSAALAQYEACRRVLAEELGVEPGAETVALVEHIREDALSKRAGEGGSKEGPLPLAPQLSRSPALRHNLPAQTTPFVGREGELADLARLLDQPDIRLVTIFAPGGMGKTRLALEIAAAQVDRYPNGVYLVPLAPLGEPETMVSAIAEAVGYPFQADNRSPRQQLLDYFREKELLLLLDNFEHLLEGVDLITAILQAAPGVRMLVTSRERLRLSGETLFSLEGLDYPQGETERGTDYSAFQLFIQSARRVQPAFAPEGEELQAIARICRLVVGMPLAILLAAAWTEMLTPQEIAAEIGQSFDFLESDLRDLPERQRSLRAVFEQTWRRLSEAERDAFMRLSVFRGGFTREAAQAVSGASLRTLAALVNKALLQGIPGERYEIHELVRQYAEEQLAASGQGEVTRDAHGAYYLDFLQQRQADLKGGRQLEALAEIEADHENVYLAWRWAVAQGQLDRLDQAMESLGLFYHSRGRYLEGEVACQLAAEELTASGAGLRILARTLTWQSIFSQRLGRGDLVNQLVEQSLALLDRPELAGQDTRSERAFALLRRPYPEGQRPHLEESLALYRAAGDRWGTAWVLEELGRTAMWLGAYHEAKQFTAESLALRRALGDRKGMANSLEVLTYIASHQGQLAETERFARESYAIFQDIGDPAGISLGFFLVGCAHLWRGQFAKAQTLFEQGWTISKEVGDRLHSNHLNIRLAQTSLHLGQYRQAQVWGQTGLATAQEIGFRSQGGHALLELGKVKMVEGAYAEARQLLAESNTIYREIGQLDKLGWVLPPLGYTDRGLGNLPLAQQHLAEALGLVSDRRDFFALVGALPLAALLSVDRGEIERAVELYALARRYPHVANSRWYEDVAGRQIAAAAETLPPEIVAAAQERGRARDLWATVAELLAELEDSV